MSESLDLVLPDGKLLWMCPECGTERYSDPDLPLHHEHPEVGEPWVAFIPKRDVAERPRARRRAVPKDE